MATYSIKEISEKTGFTTSALRVWESRYRWPRSKRLDNGYRVYSDLDLEEILRVKLFIAEGHPIGTLIDDDGFVRFMHVTGPVTGPRSKPNLNVVQHIPKPVTSPGRKLYEELLHQYTLGDHGEVLRLAHEAIMVHPSDRCVVLASVFLYVNTYQGQLRSPELAGIRDALPSIAGSYLPRIADMASAAWDAHVKAGYKVIQDEVEPEAVASQGRTA
jgi:hypothetical protein